MSAFRSRSALASSCFLMGMLTLFAPATRAQAGAAGTPVKVEPAKPSAFAVGKPVEGPQKTQPEGGAQVGIKMHGHWVIDVKNPDGTIAEHRDFENAITNNGAELLIGLLSGYVVPSDYGVFLQTTTAGTGPCPTISSGGQGGCIIVRSLGTSPATGFCQTFSCVTGLTTTPTFNDSATSGTSSLVFAGSLTASQAGSINQVSTLYGICPGNEVGTTSLATVSPSTCSTAAGNSSIRYLSATTFTAVNVAVNQVVQVTVTITFS